jgi:hypothetical protein
MADSHALTLRISMEICTDGSLVLTLHTHTHVPLDLRILILLK